ncbi:hypothetical protein PENTCL1PPCAC_14317, partial [Pristionchus entomophagus]
ALCRMMTFEEASERIKILTFLTNAELLELYSLYKQGTLGDNNIAKPGRLDMKGQAKWYAWDVKKGISKEDAQNRYIVLVERLLQKYK